MSLELKCLLVIEWELKNMRIFSCVCVSPMLRVHFNCNTSMRNRMSWECQLLWLTCTILVPDFFFSFCCCTGLFTAFRSVMIIKRLYSWKLIQSLISFIGLRESGFNQGPKLTLAKLPNASKNWLWWIKLFSIGKLHHNSWFKSKWIRFLMMWLVCVIIVCLIYSVQMIW